MKSVACLISSVSSRDPPPGRPAGRPEIADVVVIAKESVRSGSRPSGADIQSPNPSIPPIWASGGPSGPPEAQIRRITTVYGPNIGPGRPISGPEALLSNSEYSVVRNRASGLSQTTSDPSSSKFCHFDCYLQRFRPVVVHGRPRGRRRAGNEANISRSCQIWTTTGRMFFDFNRKLY